ncbi:MAG: hypothetical protein K8R67_07100 [Desulfobacteraceae bacterium]|nr:hypothetical protein [Desulfobacteraceae bacterium]
MISLKKQYKILWLLVFFFILFNIISAQAFAFVCHEYTLNQLGLSTSKSLYSYPDLRNDLLKLGYVKTTYKNWHDRPKGQKTILNSTYKKGDVILIGAAHSGCFISDKIVAHKLKGFSIFYSNLKELSNWIGPLWDPNDPDIGKKHPYENSSIEIYRIPPELHVDVINKGYDTQLKVFQVALKITATEPAGGPLTGTITQHMKKSAKKITQLNLKGDGTSKTYTGKYQLPGDYKISIVVKDLSGSETLWEGNTGPLERTPSPPPAVALPRGIGTIGFGQQAYEFREDAGVVTILVLRSGDMSDPLTVRWKIYDGNTNVNQDYVSNFGKLEWTANDSNPKPISIEILDDSDPERLEYAYIELYNVNSPGQTNKITGQNPVKLNIIDNDSSAFEADENQLFCQFIKIIPNRLAGKPGQTFRLNQVFRVIALMSDNREMDVTRDARLIWEPGTQYTFPQKSKFNERLKVKVSFLDCRATARIDVEYPFWSAPISDADDLQAKTGAPPADAYVWYVICDKQYYNVVYTQHLDLTRDIVMAGPFPGPREPAMWIEENCPRAKCNKGGECSQDSAVRGGPWGVYCNTKTGEIVVTKNPQVHHRKFEDNFEALTEAQLWTDQHYPSWLCDHLGAYVEDGFSELSSTVGKSKKNTTEGSDFAEIGGESARKILRESSDATRMSYGGMKGGSMHNFYNNLDNIMGKEFKEKRAAQKREAQEFLNEFLTRTTNDFYEYQKKRVAQKQLPPKTGSYQSNKTGTSDKSYINNLKCKNAGSYLRNAIKVKNLEYAREVLNEIKIARCDYYSNAKAEVDKLEKQLARQNACDHYGGELQDALNRKNISGAKANLEKFKDCPNYEAARTAVAKLENKLACKQRSYLQTRDIYDKKTWGNSTLDLYVDIFVMKGYTQVSCGSSDAGIRVWNDCTQTWHCYKR